MWPRKKIANVVILTVIIMLVILYLPRGSCKKRAIIDFIQMPKKATIVTAYYCIQSKHTAIMYDTWMCNLLSLRDPMVIFTSADQVEKITKLRTPYLDDTLIIIKELSDTNVAKGWDRAFWEGQLAMDPEKARHKSYELYWVWLSKTWFLKHASELNPFASDFFAWVDIGYLRQPSFNHTIMLKRLPSVLRRDQILLLSIHNSCGGGFIGGHVEGIARWEVLFNAQLAAKSKHSFIGKDQPLMLQTCYQQPNLCLLLPSLSYNGWFDMAHHLGSP
jgi:hypothetical protein